MAKLHLEGGVTFEGTPEEIKAYTDLYAEKAELKSEPKSAQELKVGDFVTIDLSRYKADITEGKAYEVLEDSDGDLYFLDDDNDERFDPIAEGAYTIVEAPQQSFKVGDYIVGNDAERYGITNDKMTLGKVVKELVSSDDIRVEVLRHATKSDKVGNSYLVESKHFRKATAEEIADYEESLKPSFKEGDIVVITGNTNASRNAVGDIGKVGEYTSERGADVDVPGKTSGNGNFTLKSEMRHATPAEREQYEANLKQAEKDAIFTKIGRKPGEFKEGDIVRVIDSPSASPNETIVEITSVHSDHLYAKGWSTFFHEVTTYAYGFDSIELITPVESRLDLKAGA